MKLPTFQSQNPVNFWCLSNDQRQAIAEHGYIVGNGWVISGICSITCKRSGTIDDYIAIPTEYDHD
ncbi:MAG: hypothetical protein AAFZ49_00170 [Cyanobacteria bacterium J06659_2]